MSFPHFLKNVVKKVLIKWEGGARGYFVFGLCYDFCFVQKFLLAHLFWEPTYSPSHTHNHLLHLSLFVSEPTPSLDDFSFSQTTKKIQKITQKRQITTKPKNVSRITITTTFSRSKAKIKPSIQEVNKIYQKKGHWNSIIISLSTEWRFDCTHNKFRWGKVNINKIIYYKVRISTNLCLISLNFFCVILGKWRDDPYANCCKSAT